MLKEGWASHPARYPEPRLTPLILTREVEHQGYRPLGRLWSSLYLSPKPVEPGKSKNIVDDEIGAPASSLLAHGTWRIPFALSIGGIFSVSCGFTVGLRPTPDKNSSQPACMPPISKANAWVTGIFSLTHLPSMFVLILARFRLAGGASGRRVGLL